jgi:Dolichyl-phosphate-mannose-protein mannosyltransferase
MSPVHPPVDDPAETRGPPKRWATVLAFGVVVLGLARHVPVLNLPWGSDLGSICSAFYYARSIGYWARFGFDELGWIPFLHLIPGSPPLGMPYLNHPPAFPWIAYAWTSAFGTSEAAFRALPSLFAALTGGLVVLLAARSGNKWSAALAGTLWLALPMTFLYGSMCNPESTTLFWMLLTFVLHLQLRASTWPAYLLVVGSQVVAAQLDWQAHFVVPALFLYEWSRPRADRRFGRVMLLAFASVLSAGIALALIGFLGDAAGRAFPPTGAGGALPAFEIGALGTYVKKGVLGTVATAAANVRGQVSPSVGAWFERQAIHVGSMFTWPAALAVFAAAVTRCFRRSEGLTVGLLLLVPGVLNVLVFRLHATNHEFWTYCAAPGVAILVPEVTRIVTKSWLGAAGWTLVIVAFAAPTIASRVHDLGTSRLEQVATEVAGLLERPSDVVVCDDRFAVVSYYSRHWTLPVENPLAEAPGLVADKRAGRLHGSLVLLVADDAAARQPGFESVLANVDRATRIDADQARTRLPALSESMGAGAWWVLRVE